MNILSALNKMETVGTNIILRTVRLDGHSYARNKNFKG
jgi:hypothetical protein